VCKFWVCRITLGGRTVGGNIHFYQVLEIVWLCFSYDTLCVPILMGLTILTFDLIISKWQYNLGLHLSWVTFQPNLLYDFPFLRYMPQDSGLTVCNAMFYAKNCIITHNRHETWNKPEKRSSNTYLSILWSTSQIIMHHTV